MKQLVRTAAGLFTAILLVFVPLVSVSAQPSELDTVFTSQITGDDIEIGESGALQFVPDQYEFSVNTTFQEEYIWIWSSYSTYELILIDGPTDAELYTEITLENMEAFYDSWVLLDTESDVDTAWFLGEAEIDGEPLYVYYEYEVDVFGDVDFAYMQFSIDIDLIPDMQLAQDLITVGGLSVPLNPDLPTIAELIGMPLDDTESTPAEDEETTTQTGTTSRTSRTVSTDEDETTDQTETTTTTSRTSRTGTVKTDETSGQTSTTTRTSRTTVVDSDQTNDSETSGSKGTSTDRTTTNTQTDEPEDGGWADLGLIDDATWESPTHGATIEWDLDLWEFPVDYESAILIDPDGWDSLTLQTTDGLGYVFVTVDYTMDFTPRTLLDYWQTEEYLSGVGADAVIIDSAQTRDSASIIYVTTNLADEPIVVIMDGSFQDDGTVVYTQLTAAPETIAEVYANYVDGVFYNGGALNLTWDVEEIGELQP
ncbi:MAG: hypothetical protein M9950_02670 [Thermomicrobiales bacterium]|nr:hypothetical protein [Thermomicrobiales bacterium]